MSGRPWRPPTRLVRPFVSETRRSAPIASRGSGMSQKSVAEISGALSVRQSLRVAPSDSRSQAAGRSMGRSEGTPWVVSEHFAKVPPASLRAAMVGSA